ncbi:MAG: homoserine dehydrogenase [Elusimicrobia bacterium]|nr:homoserine dehydrogenase [Elusimicrobiota bacterium]
MKKIKIAIVGYGNVGKGVVKILENNKTQIEHRVGSPIELMAICDLFPIAEKAIYCKRYQDIIKREDIDIVVELIGGYEPARTIILESLKSGKNIVTANKAVIAKHWDEIFSTARRYKKLVYFEASVGGAIPVIQGLHEGLAANKVEKIMGILNGTTNYILSAMSKEGISFKEGLAKAKKFGFAEADPTLDVEGIDTANKLAILSSLAWSGWIKMDSIDTKGISSVTKDDVNFAKKFGYVIKLIGEASMGKNGLALSVGPCLISSTHAFANVNMEYNAVLIHGDASGDVMFYGKGSGQLPAASAVVSDIIFLARQIVNETAGKLPYVVADPSKKIKIMPKEKSSGTFYLRFSAKDIPGVLSKVSGILGRYNVSIASVYQEEPLSGLRKKVPTPIIILTHPTNHGNLDKALRMIDKLPIIKAKTVKFRIEN